MPLNPQTLSDGLDSWMNAKGSTEQAIAHFVDAYHNYMLPVTCLGIPIANPAALTAAKSAMKAALIPVFHVTAPPPVWQVGVYASLALYLNTLVASSAFGPAIIPPVVALPEPLTTSLVAAAAIGMSGGTSIQVRAVMSTALDIWTRVSTATVSATGSPAPFI